MDPGLDPTAYFYVHELRVRFAETDAMGVVHHAAYLPYLEEARVAYLRAKGRPYGEIRAGAPSRTCTWTTSSKRSATR